MRLSAAALVFCLLPAASARAQDDAPSTVSESDAPAVDQEAMLNNMADKLKNDPAVANSLAARLNRSSLADRISGAPDEETRRQEIRAWIAQDPKSAAGLAVGLASDDASGTHDFERAIAQTVHTKLEFNPNSKKGIFGRLRQNAKDSGLMKKQGEDMADEEKREVFKNMFEGQGGQSGKILTQQLEDKKGGGPGAVGAAGTAGLGSSYFDRLSQSNIRGYSPQLQATTVTVPARELPGSPKLIETGKLDYETLSYPAYGMNFDVANLDKQLRYELNFALAKALGVSGQYKPADLLDPAVEQKLKAQAAGKPLPPGFERRLKALEAAKAALAEFSQAALAAKDPNQISRPLLMTLGAKQKEAARWITAASLEEEAQRLEPELNFLTPELIQSIHECQADDDARSGYMRRGEEFQRAVKRLRDADEAAIAALQADDWLSRIDAVQASLAQAGPLRKDLMRNIEDFRATAYRFDQTADMRPGWRRTLDGYAERLLPGSGYAQGLRRGRRAHDLLKDVFVKIASGDFEAAHTVLASYEPAR